MRLKEVKGGKNRGQRRLKEVKGSYRRLKEVKRG